MHNAGLRTHGHGAGGRRKAAPAAPLRAARGDGRLQRSRPRAPRAACRAEPRRTSMVRRRCAPAAQWPAGAAAPRAASRLAGAWAASASGQGQRGSARLEWDARATNGSKQHALSRSADRGALLHTLQACCASLTYLSPQGALRQQRKYENDTGRQRH